MQQVPSKAMLRVSQATNGFGVARGGSKKDSFSGASSSFLNGLSSTLERVGKRTFKTSSQSIIHDLFETITKLNKNNSNKTNCSGQRASNDRRQYQGFVLFFGSKIQVFSTAIYQGQNSYFHDKDTRNYIYQSQGYRQSINKGLSLNVFLSFNRSRVIVSQGSLEVVSFPIFAAQLKLFDLFSRTLVACDIFPLSCDL